MKRKLFLLGGLAVLTTLQACVAIPEHSATYGYDAPVYYPRTTVYSGIYYSPGPYYVRPPAPRMRQPHSPPRAQAKPPRHPGSSSPSTRPPSKGGSQAGTTRPPRPTAGNRPHRAERPALGQTRPARPRTESRPSRPQAPNQAQRRS